MDKLIKLSMKGKEEFTWSVAVGEEVDGALKECKKSFILFLLFWFSSMSLSLFFGFCYHFFLESYGSSMGC
jgi:hypothetical protein